MSFLNQILVEETELTFFEPDAPYSEKPLSKQIVRNEDYVIIDTKNLSTLTWESKDEAINFFENTFKNTDNEISMDIDWENYDRSAWDLEDSEGNRIVLRWTNAGDAGDSYVELFKGEEFTDLYLYKDNTSYPDSPSMQYIIRNDDFIVDYTVELGKIE